jgi:NAD(P)H-hydrate epimerase
MMLGAPALAAMGALRSGVGIARLMMPEPILPAALATCPAAVGVPMLVNGYDINASAAAEEFDRQLGQINAVVIGPGLGQSEAAAALVLRTLQQEELPVIVDADALNILAGTIDLWRDFRAPAVLTPHPGEFRRLADALRISADPTDPATRPEAAAALARRLGCIVVLKGSGTIVSDGLSTWLCTRGHVCLATGGTGDILAGLIGGLAAQYCRVTHTTALASRGIPTPISLLDISRIAVQAHAIAGERWAQEHQASGGLLAPELADLLPAVLEQMRD